MSICYFIKTKVGNGRVMQLIMIRKSKPKKTPWILVADLHIRIFTFIDMKSYKFEESYSMNDYFWLDSASIQLFRTLFSPFS